MRKDERFCEACGYYNGEKDTSGWDDKIGDNNLFDDYEEPTTEESDNKNQTEEYEEFNLKADSSGTKDTEFYYENEDLLEAFIGEDYKSIKKIPFNLFAFLLNWGYVLYRKLYITGVIGLIVTGIIKILADKVILIIKNILKRIFCKILYLSLFHTLNIYNEESFEIVHF